VPKVVIDKRATTTNDMKVNIKIEDVLQHACDFSVAGWVENYLKSM